MHAAVTEELWQGTQFVAHEMTDPFPSVLST